MTTEIQPDQINSTNLDAATLDGYDISNLVLPTGSIIVFAGSVAPGGWIKCDGSAVSRLTYENLFNVINTTYGTGDGSTTFNLPDLRRRTAVGTGGAATSTLGNTTGSIGGSENHTLNIAQMPIHTHSVDAHSHNTLAHNHSFNYWATVNNHSCTQTIPQHDNVPQGAPEARYTDNAAANGSSGAVIVTIANNGTSNSHTNIQPSIVLNYIIKT